MSSRLDFDFSSSAGRPGRKRKDADPFRILILGDFSGRASAAAADSSPGSDTPRIFAIDVDNFDDVLSRIAPTVALPAAPDLLFLHGLDDFHPDRLIDQVPSLRRLMELRRSLQDPGTAQEVMAMLNLTPPPGQGDDSASGQDTESADATVARLLGKAPSPKNLSAPSVIDDLVRRAVEPHVHKPEDTRHTALAAGLDRALSDAARRVLQSPPFKGLEALWRATWWLVSGLETDETLSVHILDLSLKELEDDLAAGNVEPETCLLGRTLAAQGPGQPGAEEWSLAVGAYSFHARIDQLKLLALLGATTGQAGAPFLAAAGEDLLGCRSIAGTPDPGLWTSDDDAVESAWQGLRASAIAPWVGLALPRLLLRLPYGEDTDPVTSFSFEEATSRGDPASLLWGNPAIGCALLLGQSFQDAGWGMQPGDRLALDDLPAYTYRAEDESRLTPVAEHYLNDRQAEAIMSRGIMPFISHRRYNLARISRFQSIANPATSLSGPWLRE